MTQYHSREWRAYYWDKFLKSLDDKKFTQSLKLAKAIQAEKEQSENERQYKKAGIQL